ncbi:MAG TPA: DUF4124 domain-containing protein [Myxococcota bacterium]|nr:DUF4124 domain-containing protein [Myxococcota bacterium]
MRQLIPWACALAALAGIPAHGSVLYKSVDPSGTIVFSDRPPRGDARLIEARPLERDGAVPGTLPTAMEMAFELIDQDAALAHANAEVDLAEHALALARRDLWSVRDGLRLDASSRTEEDALRVDYYRQQVHQARRALLQRLRERQLVAR